MPLPEPKKSLESCKRHTITPLSRNGDSLHTSPELTMPRLFTGIEIPASVAQSLSMMRGGLPGARWIDSENYHLTLRFIGDIDDGLAHEIAGAPGLEVAPAHDHFVGGFAFRGHRGAAGLHPHADVTRPGAC